MSASPDDGGLNAQPLSALLERFRLSPTIEKVLMECAEQVGDGRIRIGDLIRAAAASPPGSAGAALRRVLPSTVFATQSTRVRLKQLPLQVVVSPAVWQVFIDAETLRGKGGGKDEFLGLRHVLFSLFTLQVEVVKVERDSFLRRHDANPQRAAEAIAAFVIEAMEPQESASFWAYLMSERGLSDYAGFLQGGPARRPKSRKKPGRTGKVSKKSTLVDSTSQIVVCQADDPWDPRLRDHFDVQREAEAFGAMVTATKVKPPLAIGVFGEWGAGKSFFLRMVDADIRRRALVEEPPGEAHSLKHVVQIRFNAWHYAETNLWASLVDHIFTCLDQWTRAHESADKAEQLFEHLATARRLTLESAQELIERRREQLAAEQQHAAAQQILAAAKAKAEASPANAAKAVWKSFSKTYQADISLISDEVGIPQLRESVDAFQEIAREVEGELGNSALVRSTFFRRLGSGRGIFLTASAIVLLAPGLAMLFGAVSEALLKGVTPAVAGAAGALAGLVTPLIVALNRAAQAASGTLERFRKLRADYKEQVESKLIAEREQQDIAAKELVQAQARAAESAERLRLVTEQAMEAARDHNNQTGRGRVLRFIRDRVANGTYAKHLGFVATVRKDFEQLSELMVVQSSGAIEAARFAREEYERKVAQLIEGAGDLLKTSERQGLESHAKPLEELRCFDRIVLYIDDLDRCPPEKVVQVLQAIHLLLTFPLFVVFVAVDVRWLQQSLQHHYEGHFGDGKQPGGSGRPLASDYLEKIFQIPYWVRPAEGPNIWSMLEARLGPLRPSSGETPGALGPMPSADAPVAPKGVQSEPANPISESAGPGSAPAQPTVRLLEVGSAERDFLRRLSPNLEQSPRRLLRFINTYHLIKGSLGAAERQELESGGYRLLMTLLAVNIVAEQVYGLLAAAIFNGRTTLVELSTAIQRPNVPAADAQRALAILSLLKAGDDDEVQLRSQVSLVSRYSFVRHVE